jgi:hypothetical protein
LGPGDPPLAVASPLPGKGRASAEVLLIAGWDDGPLKPTGEYSPGQHDEGLRPVRRWSERVALSAAEAALVPAFLVGQASPARARLRPASLRPRL